MVLQLTKFLYWFKNNKKKITEKKVEKKLEKFRKKIKKLSISQVLIL